MPQIDFRIFLSSWAIPHFWRHWMLGCLIPKLGWDFSETDSLSYNQHHLCYIRHLGLLCFPQNPYPGQGYTILSLWPDHRSLYSSHDPWDNRCDFFNWNTDMDSSCCLYQWRNWPVHQLEVHSYLYLYRVSVLKWTVALRLERYNHRIRSVVVGYLCFVIFCLLRLFWWSHKALSLCHEFSWELCWSFYW